MDWLLGVLAGFVLGLLSAAWAGRINKALDVQHSLLEGMATWVDEMMESAHVAAGVAQGVNMVSDERKNYLIMKRMIAGSRPIGVLNKLVVGGEDLRDAGQNFLRAVMAFEEPYLLQRNSGKWDPKVLKPLLLNIDGAASDFHTLISLQMLKDSPRWLIGLRGVPKAKGN